MYSTYAHEAALIDGLGHTRYAVGDHVHFSLLGEAENWTSRLLTQLDITKQEAKWPLSITWMNNVHARFLQSKMAYYGRH